MEVLEECCIEDRIVEDWYDSGRHSLSVGAADGQIWVVAQVRFEASVPTISDAYVEQEGRELVGVVQGLIFGDEDWATRS